MGEQKNGAKKYENIYKKRDMKMRYFLNISKVCEYINIIFNNFVIKN